MKLTFEWKTLYIKAHFFGVLADVYRLVYVDISFRKHAIGFLIGGVKGRRLSWWWNKL